MYATLQQGSSGLMYQLALLLPASVSRKQFPPASSQKSFPLEEPVIHLAGCVWKRTSWAHADTDDVSLSRTSFKEKVTEGKR